MENVYLKELIESTKGSFLLGDPHLPVKSVSIDTRTLGKEDYFFAIKGKNYDGHDYLKQAIEKGVRGVIISKLDLDLGNPFPHMPAIIRVDDTLTALGDFAGYYRQKFSIPIIGVTGSNGKTSTRGMIASILSVSGKPLATLGNLNNTIGLPLTLLRIDSTNTHGVIEMGTSEPGEIKRLAEIAKPTHSVITNIGKSHLENLISEDGVLEEKRAIFDCLSRNEVAAVNMDDPKIASIVNELKSEVITFGTKNSCDVWAEDVRYWPGYPSFTMHIKDKVVNINLKVYGRFNVYNALAASAICASLGIDSLQIKKGLEEFYGVSMRMDVRRTVSGATLINDAYNANPSSMKESIQSFIGSFQDKNKVLVLGDMLELGKGSEQLHRELGSYLDSQALSQVYFYGPMMKYACYEMKNSISRHFEDKDELVQEVLRSLEPSAAVLFKGSRGMALEEVFESVLKKDEVRSH